MRFSLKRAALSSAIMMLASLAAAYAGDEYPARPIRLVVPYGAGGASDAMARQLSLKLTEHLGQSVVVENQPAAAGAVAYASVARAAPDGYTLIYGTSSLAVTAILRIKSPYDPVKDFQPIASLVTVQNLLIVPTSLPATNVMELIQLAKKNPGKLNYVSLGTGSTPHLSAELFRSAAKINVKQVPYKQTTQAYTDLIQNRVQFWIASMPSALPHVRAEKLRALAVIGSRRSPALPDVPTLLELDIPAESTFWQGLFAPAGTPSAIIEKLNKAVRVIASDRATQAWYAKLGAELEVSTPEELSDTVQKELVKWTEIADSIGLERN